MNEIGNPIRVPVADGEFSFWQDPANLHWYFRQVAPKTTTALGPYARLSDALTEAEAMPNLRHAIPCRSIPASGWYETNPNDGRRAGWYWVPNHQLDDETVAPNGPYDSWTGMLTGAFHIGTRMLANADVAAAVAAHTAAVANAPPSEPDLPKTADDPHNPAAG